MKLSDFRVLTFDCYGTLIDWESGIADALSMLAARANVRREEILSAFAHEESAQQAMTPGMPYSRLLAEVHRRLARRWSIGFRDIEAEQFGKSVPEWPAFPDSVDALAYLKRHFALVILSNVDRESFAASNRRLVVEFDAVYTAEEIGTYKPDPNNFEYMLRRLEAEGYSKSDILHTAQSLYHDHAPATGKGLATAWIDRRSDKNGWGATRPPATKVGTDFHFRSLADFVEHHQRECSGNGS